MRSFIKTRGARRPRSPRPSTTPEGYSHKEECNPDGPSQIERGDIREMDLRTVIGLRAAIDDAIFKVAERFGLRYNVLRGQHGVDGAVYKIGLEVRERRTTTVYLTGNAPIVPSSTPGKPLGAERLHKASSK